MRLQQVAKDTVAYCKRDKCTTKSILISDIPVETRVSDKAVQTRVSIHKEDYITLAYAMTLEYCRVAILNMASDKKPGGGFLDGATAGEEELCRRTTLYPQLLNFKYPLVDTILYSKDVEIFKDAGSYKRLKPTKYVDVISASAVRNPKTDEFGNYANIEDKKTMQIRIRAILETAKEKGVECLILSAFGSGAFRNPAEEVAKIFKNELQGYSFPAVCFGILDDTLQGRATNNFEVYQRIFSEEQGVK